MTLHFYIHTATKRAKTTALLNSGATKNFLNLSYAKWLKLLIKCLPSPRKLYNVDGTQNKSGELQFYTDLSIQTGSNCTNMRFFLTDLGDHKAILALPLDLLPPPSSVFPTPMSTSHRESSPFYLLVTDPENDAHITHKSIDTLLDMVNCATAEFSAADRACVKWYCMENGDIPAQDCFKLLLATVSPLYGQVFANHSMDEYIPNYRSHAISTCLSALLAFCKIVSINGPYATPSPSPSPSTAPPSPLLLLGLATQTVNLQGLCEDTMMDSKLTIPTASVVPPLHPVSSVLPGPLTTSLPPPPTHPPVPAAASKPKPTHPTALRPKPAPAEGQGGPKPPRGKPGPSVGEGIIGSRVGKQMAQAPPQGKGTSQPPSYAATAAVPRLPTRASLVISLSHSTATTHLCAQASMAPASLVTICNDALVKASCHANVWISTARWTPKGNLVVIGGPATSIAQLKDATHVLTTAIQSMLPEPMTSLASQANVKWSKLLINGVPTGIDEETLAHSSTECQCALTLDNPLYGHLTITQLPSCVRSPFSYTSGSYLSLVIVFEDPDGSIASSMVAAKWLYLFGAQATIKRWKQKPRISRQSFMGQGPRGPQATTFRCGCPCCRQCCCLIFMPPTHPHPARP